MSPRFILQDLLPLITAHTPAGTSTYNIVHYLQEYHFANRNMGIKLDNYDAVTKWMRSQHVV